MQDRFKFRVYYEALINGKIVKGVESEASWFALTQTGSLLEVSPCRSYTEAQGYKVLKPLMCTGLRDKNGQLIFEGDIVEYKIPGIPKITAVVSWSGQSAHFWKGAQDLATYQKTTVIIGNIYENPELLPKSETYNY